MKKKSNILAIDTAMAGCTVSLSKNGELFFRSLETKYDQARILLPFIIECLKEAQLSFQDLDGLACTNGPGSFTGVRIGIATIKALALALNKPVVAISNFDLMVKHCIQEQKIQKKDQILIVLETKRSDFYVQLYDFQGKAIKQACSYDIEDILDWLEEKRSFYVCGDATQRFEQELPTKDKEKFSILNQIILPNSDILASIADEIFNVTTLTKLEPVYMSGAHISKPKKKLRTIAES